MQDPSHGVAQALVCCLPVLSLPNAFTNPKSQQNHVHLLSGHRFPIQPSLNVEQAFRYLIDAPTIVKQTAPMSWTYVQAPQDGTVWLEWMPGRNGEYRFASDGYVWLDPEQTYRHDFGGYTIEWMVHTVGYRPQFDQFASHARTRYHFISKNPSVAAAPPDPSLWIVHYHQADQSRMIPVNSVPISNPMRQSMNERRWLEAQGRLERKDFMLHDREHWPTIQIPSNAHMPPTQQPGMHANPMMPQQMNQQRYPQYPFPQAQGPPAKRARHSGPNVMPGSSDGVHDMSIEAEEDTTTGDFFDHLTPREISMARYMQHHRWMEEVFSSPYASSQIVPPDLGLGLMGELKGLTDGILDPPAPEIINDSGDKPVKAKEAGPFSNLKKEQVEEFNKRVEKHLQDGQAEIERMKKEHAEKMGELKKTKTLMQAEKRMRFATWEGHESAVPTYRLDVPPMNGHAEDGPPPENVEDVVKDVESLLGVKIQSHKDVTLVEKGGLEKEEEQPFQEMVQDGMMESEKESSDLQPQPPVTNGANGRMSEHQPSFVQQPLSNEAETAAEALQPSIPADVPQPTFEGEQQIQSIAQDGTEPQPRKSGDMPEHHEFDEMEGMEGVDMGDTSLIEGMDMNVDTGDIQFVDHSPGVADDGNLVPDSAPELPAQPEQQAALEQLTNPAGGVGVTPTESPAMFGESMAQEEQQLEQPQITEPVTAVDDVIPITTAEIDVAALTEPAAMVGEVPTFEGAGDDNNNIFDDGTFDDLTTMGGDGNGADGLIDFDGGMGMEDSAFGDALHGMDLPGGDQGDGDDAGHDAAQQVS